MKRLFAVTALVIHVLVGLLIASIVWPLSSSSFKRRSEQWFASRLLKIVGVRLQVEYACESSKPVTGVGKLYLSNHVSWLDIFAFNSNSPITFIAKSEIASWPLAGALARKSGTLFIERGRRHAVRDVVHKAADCLKSGRDVAVFPEGTTGPGDAPLHFHSNFVQPAILANVPVVPVSLQYLNALGQWTPAPAYLGEQSLVENLQVLLANLGEFKVKLLFHCPMEIVDETRHEISGRARELISQGLQLR